MTARNSQKIKIHQYSGIVPWENHSDNLKTHFKDLNEASNDRGNSQKAKIVLCKDNLP